MSDKLLSIWHLQHQCQKESKMNTHFTLHYADVDFVNNDREDADD